VSVGDADPLLRRLERRALAFCVVAAAGALVVQGGRPSVALGVVGGGVLIAASYWAIRSSIDGLLAVVLPAATSSAEPLTAGDRSEDLGRGAAAGARRRRAIAYGARFIGRYAVLGGLAYVMLVWLRLHPGGMMLGVSAIAVAAAIEAASSLARPSRP
jgi:hypothetical protein